VVFGEEDPSFLECPTNEDVEFANTYGLNFGEDDEDEDEDEDEIEDEDDGEEHYDAGKKKDEGQ